MEPEKVYRMDVSKVYPLLVDKAVRKGRTRTEVDEVICWLTGYSRWELEALLKEPISYADFFQGAPCLNENRHLITGTVCGIRVEEIGDPLMQNICYLDKLVDELAKGKTLELILRR